MEILIIGAVTFGVCFLIDKGFTTLFRSKPQHRSGRSVRLSQHLGGAGIIMLLLGLAAAIYGWNSGLFMLIAGIVIGLVGVGLIVYYMTFGIYYDQDSLILTTFGKKSVEYSFGDIKGQKLYQVTGGGLLIELYFQDGRSVTLQSNMSGVYEFLDAAFAGWCSRKNLRPEDCAFHNKENSCWFPSVEE